MRPTHFLAHDEWTEHAVKTWVERHGWYAWRQVEGGWMIFQYESDLRNWKNQK